VTINRIGHISCSDYQGAKESTVLSAITTPFGTKTPKSPAIQASQIKWKTLINTKFSNKTASIRVKSPKKIKGREIHSSVAGVFSAFSLKTSQM
jgi:hypothetical protein